MMVKKVNSSPVAPSRPAARRVCPPPMGSLLFFAGILLAAMVAGCSSNSGKSGSFNNIMQGMLDKMTGHDKKPLTYEASQMFNSDDPDAQRAAIAYISTQKFGHDKVYMKAYQLAATSSNPMVRGQALVALGTSGQASVAPTLITGLSDPSSFVRMCAAMGLTHVPNALAIAPLRDRLADDTSIQVRVYCAIALAHYNQRPVIRSLIDAMDNRNVAVVHAAWTSLCSLTGQKLPQHSGPWRTWLKQSAAGMAMSTGN